MTFIYLFIFVMKNIIVRKCLPKQLFIIRIKIESLNYIFN